jgi:hypothetical protein
VKITSILLLFLISFTLLSCDKTENSVLSANENNITQSQDLSYIDDISSTNTLTLSKEIDGQIGGQIPFNTTILDAKGTPVLVNILLTFDPGSFTGKKIIGITPNVNTGSVQFTPKIIFTKPAKLDLSFTGINLNNLGFNSNSIVDFVYKSDDGTVEFILKNECKIKWDSKVLYTKKAQLPHFSRYIFVKRSL